MCDTYTPDNEPLPNNHRVKAVETFNRGLEEEPWFGLEQEYFLFNPITNKPMGFPTHGLQQPQGRVPPGQDAGRDRGGLRLHAGARRSRGRHASYGRQSAPNLADI